MNLCSSVSIFPNCEDYSEIILSIILFVIFIVVFYFTYGLYMERKILDKEISSIVMKLKNTTIMLNPSSKLYIKSVLKNLNINNNTDADTETEKHNTTILTKIYIILPILFVVGLLLSFFLSTKWGNKLFGGHCGEFSYKNVLLKNLIVIIMITLTEFIFITYYASEYISIDANDVISILLSKIIDYRNKESNNTQSMQQYVKKLSK